MKNMENPNQVSKSSLRGNDITRNMDLRLMATVTFGEVSI